MTRLCATGDEKSAPLTDFMIAVGAVQAEGMSSDVKFAEQYQDQSLRYGCFSTISLTHSGGIHRWPPLPFADFNK